MNGNQLITKHSANFDTIEKSKRPGVLATLRGPVTGWKPNRNGRTYSRDLWVKALNSDYVKEQVALNHFVGEADHPEERLEPVIQNMSHAMRDFEFDDANQEVIATIDILDTPCGNMLKTLYDYSGALSFSTRGSGDVLEDGEVDPDTYQLFAIDAVLRPSYATATVRNLLTESENLHKDKDVEKVLESYSGKLEESVSWNYYDRFGLVTDKYMPSQGEGETLASQLVTAVNKLIYKWYNDGDIYDNSNPAGMTGWANDLSSYANWLAKYIDGAKPILDGIFDLSYGSESEYEDLLRELADALLSDADYLEQLNQQPKEGSIYDCSGDYSWDESRNYDEEEYESENLTEATDEEARKMMQIQEWMEWNDFEDRWEEGAGWAQPTFEFMKKQNYNSFVSEKRSWVAYKDRSALEDFDRMVKSLNEDSDLSEAKCVCERCGKELPDECGDTGFLVDGAKYCVDCLGESLEEDENQSYADLVWDKFITGKFADQHKGVDEICNKLDMNYETEFGEIDRLHKWIYSMDDSELRSYFPYLDEVEKLNEYGDTRDYSEEIQKLFKKWFKENTSLGIRAWQAATSSYDLDVEVRDQGEGSERRKVYKAINNSPFIEVEEWADEIGKYIADSIGSIKYVKSTYNDKSIFSGDETAGDITFYFVQQIGMPDFGAEFESENLSEIDTWVDPRSKQDGWKVKVLDVIPDDYAGSTVAKVELIDPNGESQGEDTTYIHRQDVKIGQTYDAYIDGIMAMPRIKGVSDISYDEVPDMRKVTRDRYINNEEGSMEEQDIKEAGAHVGLDVGVDVPDDLLGTIGTALLADEDPKEITEDSEDRGSIVSRVIDYALNKIQAETKAISPEFMKSYTFRLDDNSHVISGESREGFNGTFYSAKTLTMINDEGQDIDIYIAAENASKDLSGYTRYTQYGSLHADELTIHIVGEEPVASYTVSLDTINGAQSSIDDQAKDIAKEWLSYIETDSNWSGTFDESVDFLEDYFEYHKGNF